MRKGEQSNKRIYVFFSGRVQGVGFRFTAVDVAESIGIVGWIRNIRNGGVEAVCEGEEEKLKRFLEEIASGPLRYYIKDTNVLWEDPTGEFTSFEIRF